jgi:lipopolysaccharide/colanic/teichoic acid biosynthesis glycosyltransferase
VASVSERPAFPEQFALPAQVTVPGQAATHPRHRRPRPRGRGSAAAKRTFDVLACLVALLLLSPLLAAIAVAVRLDSPGPVLFRQTRIGRDGTPFRILKFRTMVDGAARLAANVSPDGDPRVTRTGAVLRRTYLDELPQLLNVVRGDMSLVGPRPETPEFVSLYDDDERRVLTVRVGLVGPSTLAFMHEGQLLADAEDAVALYQQELVHARARADLTYLDAQSLRYDIRLLVRQLFAILRGT